MDPLWLNHNNITNTNVSEEKSPLTRLEALELPMQMFMVCLFSLTSCLALVGNLLVIIVELFGKRSALNLRKFLINLAISDILLGVFSVPFTYTDFMLGRWIFPSWLCPTAQFVQIQSVFVTAFTLTIIGIERYTALVHPLSNANQLLENKCNLILALGWVFGSLLAGISVCKTSTHPFNWENQTFYDCRNELDEDWSKIYATFSFIVTFAIPLLIQTFSYVAIGHKLIGEKQLSTKLLRKSSQHNHRKIIHMLVAVVITFSICWLPIKIFILLLVYWPEMLQLSEKISYYTYISSFFFCHWLAMANSFVNPIIYSFMSRSFRADFKDLLGRLKTARKKPSPDQSPL